MSKKNKAKRRKSSLLQLSVWVIVFIMLFSIVGVIGIYLNGISQQQEYLESYQQQLQEQIDDISVNDIQITTGTATILTGNQNDTGVTVSIGSGNNAVIVATGS